MFILAISWLITSNLSWFLDLTLQVPIQYDSLQHQPLLLSPVTSTTRQCSCFGSVSSFFLELFLLSSPVVYWAPTDLGNFIFQCPIFLPFHTAHVVLKATMLKGFAIPFSSGPCFCQNSPEWSVHLAWPYTQGFVLLIVSIMAACLKIKKKEEERKKEKENKLELEFWTLEIRIRLAITMPRVEKFLWSCKTRNILIRHHWKQSFS